MDLQPKQENFLQNAAVFAEDIKKSYEPTDAFAKEADAITKKGR